MRLMLYMVCLLVCGPGQSGHLPDEGRGAELPGPGNAFLGGDPKPGGRRRRHASASGEASDRQAPGRETKPRSGGRLIGCHMPRTISYSSAPSCRDQVPSPALRQLQRCRARFLAGNLSGADAGRGWAFSLDRPGWSYVPSR